MLFLNKVCKSKPKMIVQVLRPFSCLTLMSKHTRYIILYMEQIRPTAVSPDTPTGPLCMWRRGAVRTKTIRAIPNVSYYN